MHGRGKNKDKHMTPEDALLWSRFIRTVKPLHPLHRVIPDPGEKLPTNPTTLQKHISPRPHTPSPGRKVTPSQPLPDISHMRRVRRGQVFYEQVLDLHGLKQDEARIFVLKRVERAYQQGLGCLLVITGKGSKNSQTSYGSGVYGSETVGVLRRSLTGWLHHERIRAYIASYAPAHQRHGGSGAFYVFLRKNPDIKPVP